MSLSRYARLTLVVNLAVILWGAYVRASGSGAGCGRHWPLCNGVVVPRSAGAQTLIEFGHRITSGVALVMIVGLAISAFRARGRGHPLRRLAGSSVLFIVTEALIGAGLVKLGLVGDDDSLLRVIYLPLHLANTFGLLASLTLAALAAEPAEPAAGSVARPPAITSRLALGLILVVGVTGALTALGDTLFPAESLRHGLAQDSDPTAHFLVRLRVVHPALAVLAALTACVAAYRAGSGSPAAAVPARWLIGFSIGQLAVGTLNLLLLAPIATQLLHLLMADLMWITAVAMASREREPTHILDTMASANSLVLSNVAPSIRRWKS